MSKPAQLSTEERELFKRNLKHFRVVESFRDLLKPALNARTEIEASEADPRRTLHAYDYFSMMLFAMHNPIVQTMRGVCRASHYDKIQKRICSGPVSPSMFSEAQHVFTPDLLDGLFADLVQQIAPASDLPGLESLKAKLTLVDGSLFSTLKRMGWTEKGDRSRRGAKLHVQYDVARRVATEFKLTDGKTCERKTLIRMLQPGRFYVGDRYYATGYNLMAEILQLNEPSYFVFRLQDTAFYQILEPREVPEDAQRAGVISDQTIDLGRNAPLRGLRLVIVENDGHRFLLATNDPLLSAVDIAQIYRLRWEIEVYFKWFKCNLRIGHFLAESENGVAMQLYCALIMALLLQLAVGRRPKRRDLELIQFYQQGLVSDEEVAIFLHLKNNA
jgi:hypothetical protein